MNVVAIIQARMGSTRLLGKTLREILGKPMLWHVVNRVKYCKLINKIVIATTKNERDRPILKLANEMGIDSYRGSEDDLLDRYYQAIQKYPADVIARITSDCPLIDPEIVDRIVGHYLANRNNFDCVANSLPPTYPAGMDVDVLSFSTLELAWHEATDPLDREHIIRYIFARPDKFRLANVRNEKDYSHLRLTVDQIEDLILVRKIYKKLWTEKGIFRLKDIIEFLEQNPKLLQVNINLQSWKHHPILRDPEEMDKLQKVTQIYP